MNADSTAVIAFFTVALVIFTTSLARSTKKAVNVARDSAERQLRAYLTGTPVKIDSFDPSNNEIIIDVKFRNDGSIPAYNIRYNAGIGVFSNVLPTNFVFPEIGSGDWPSMIIFPRDDYTHGFVNVRSISAEEIDGVRNGRLAFYIWASIVYNDGFNKDRFTKFYFRAVHHQRNMYMLTHGHNIDGIGFRFEPAAPPEAT